MARKQDLGWAWKPEKHEAEVAKFLARAKNPKKKRRRKRKRLKGPRGDLRFAPAKHFYRSKRWMTLRLKVLETYGRKCMLCGTVDGEMHVDHIQPRSKAPELALTFENLQVLCKHCNEEKSNLHAEDYREDAVREELDRQTYLEAISLGL